MSGISEANPKLNEDCLCEIFSYLELGDQIEFMRAKLMTEKIFENSFRKLSAAKLKDWTIEKNENALRQIGKFVHHFEFDLLENNIENIRMFRLIPKYCPNITILDLKITQALEGSYSRTLCKIISNSHSIEKLEKLRLCLYSSHTQPNKVLRAFAQKCKQLIHLDLSESHHITGKYLENFSQLKILILFKCTSIQPKYLRRISETLTHLHTLDIRSIFDPNLESTNSNFDNCLIPLYKQIGNLAVSTENKYIYSEVLVNCTNLQQVTIKENFYPINDVKKLTNSLKILKLHNNIVTSKHTTTTLLELKNFPNLVELHLISFYDFWNIDWAILHTYENIRTLHISFILNYSAYFCSFETNSVKFLDFLKQTNIKHVHLMGLFDEQYLLNIMKAAKENSKLMLTIKANSENEIIQKDIEYHELKPYITVSFVDEQDLREYFLKSASDISF